MKKYLLSIILGLLITSVASARSTGCKEGNCENGFGKWVYTDKTTYEGEWVGRCFWSAKCERANLLWYWKVLKRVSDRLGGGVNETL